jgi:hypothetical protein
MAVSMKIYNIYLKIAVKSTFGKFNRGLSQAITRGFFYLSGNQGKFFWEKSLGSKKKMGRAVWEYE